MTSSNNPRAPAPKAQWKVTDLIVSPIIRDHCGKSGIVQIHPIPLPPNIPSPLASNITPSQLLALHNTCNTWKSGNGPEVWKAWKRAWDLWNNHYIEGRVNKGWVRDELERRKQERSKVIRIRPRLGYPFEKEQPIVVYDHFFGDEPPEVEKGKKWLRGLFKDVPPAKKSLALEKVVVGSQLVEVWSRMVQKAFLETSAVSEETSSSSRESTEESQEESSVEPILDPALAVEDSVDDWVEESNDEMDTDEDVQWVEEPVYEERPVYEDRPSETIWELVDDLKNPPDVKRPRRQKVVKENGAGRYGAMGGGHNTVIFIADDSEDDGEDDEATADVWHHNTGQNEEGYSGGLIALKHREGMGDEGMGDRIANTVWRPLRVGEEDTSEAMDFDDWWKDVERAQAKEGMVGANNVREAGEFEMDGGVDCLGGPFPVSYFSFYTPPWIVSVML